MSRVSVIIPSFHEESEVSPGVTVLQRTVQDILEKATGDIEVVVGFDGSDPQILPIDSRVRVYTVSPRQGIKRIINHLAHIANGKYILKTDGHCMFAPGFDQTLQDYMEDNWLVMPRFYVLDEKKWAWQDERFYDYFYLSCPFADPRGFRFKAGGHWPELTAERNKQTPEWYPVDETPQIHGSAWFCSKEFFLDKIGGFNFLDEDPLGHAQEPPWLCLKTWLGPWGGKVMVNKKTWYAHMHKGKQHDRGYRYTNDENELSYHLVANYFMKNQWPERQYNMDYFVKKFMPMPTWPDNWEEVYNKWLQS